MSHDDAVQGTPLLVLIGPPAAGKTVVGKLVAKLLRISFVDTDRRISEQHGAIPTIFAEHGEEWFRSVERSAVSTALCEGSVVSLGGGAVLDLASQRQLAPLRVAYISVSAEAVQTRLRGGSRPLLGNGITSWKAIVEARSEIYERLAARTIDSSHRSAVSIAHELAEWVQREENA